MQWHYPKRIDAPELLDEGTAAPQEVARSLQDLRRLNSLLFGVWATVTPVKARARTLPKPVTIVDVATGSGQLAQHLAGWAAREWRALRLIAVDLMPAHLDHARGWNRTQSTPQVHLMAANGTTLPFADRGVDIVVSSLFAHHLDESGLSHFFSECRRVARHGVVISDLWRHPLPFTLYRLLEPFLVRSPVTHHDSRVSFRRSYTPREVRSIAAPQLPGARVYLNFPSLRWVLEWWPKDEP